MRLLPILVLTLAMGASHAALLQDEGLQRLWDEGRHEELAQAARQSGGAPAQAALALALAQPNDEAGTEQAIELAQACIRSHPESAPCQFALGAALSQRMQGGGVLRALRDVGRIREAWEQALRLDPQMGEARVALHLGYLALPGMAGGSRERARALEVAVHDSQPELARLLRAQAALQDERADEADRELSGLRLAGAPRAFQNLALTAWSGLNRLWMKTDSHARAQARLEALAKELPQLAQPVFLLGRLAADAGRHDEALRLYERARALSGATALALDYRVAVSAQELGQKERARALFDKVLLRKGSSRGELKDVRKRLKQLST